MQPLPHPNAPLLARPPRRPPPAASLSESLHTVESWIAGLLVGGLAWAGLLTLQPIEGLLGGLLMLGVAAAVVEWRGPPAARSER